MKKSQNLFLIVVLLLLMGCTTQNANNHLSENLVEPTPKISTPTATMTALPLTSTPTLTPTLTPLPTSTPLPTLPESDAQAQILELLASNANCELPCWWGIVPGQTSKDKAISFLNQFAKLEHFRNSSHVVSFNIGMDPPGIAFNVTVSFDQELVNHIFIHTYQKSEPFVPPTRESRLKYLSVMENYRLENILSTFGEPDQIWIRSFAPNYAWFDTQTMLMYPEFGFVVIYSSESTGVGIDPMYTATCPNLSDIRLLLYDPQSELVLEDYPEFVAFHRYIDLEEATDFSISEFSTVFQSGDCETKLMTLSELWPSQYDNSKD